MSYQKDNCLGGNIKNENLMTHDFVPLHQRGRDWIETSGNVETDDELSKCIDHKVSIT